MGLVENIQSLCDKNNTNFKNLERTLNLSNGTISRWDNSKPSYDKVVKVANYFNVSIDFLITGNEKCINDYLTEEELAFVKSYSLLDQYSKNKVNNYIEVSLCNSVIKKH
ncbi:MAG: helix-turn-helix transcriptional regulator [Lachnospiraceae bacterium]|nr:helix-turn-helix transcriptional regulator [Lachnospiraceae bacterium]